MPDTTHKDSAASLHGVQQPVVHCLIDNCLRLSREKFPTNEATTLFFGISKLFQNKDPSLRQMVYLIIKELASTAEDVLMMTSSIMKDCSVGSDVVYRANAIRALCRIVDASTVPAIERLIKTAIVDKTPSVSCAALVSSYHLLPVAKDVVRRWQNEVQEAATGSKSGGFSLGFGGAASHTAVPSNSNQSQYHAIALLYSMRSQDRMSLVKMVQQYSQPGVLKSPAATMLLVRLASKLAEEEPGLRKQMQTLLSGWLQHKSEMVNFEAAKSICSLPDVPDSEINNAVHVLQLFLTSPRAVTKFAAVRILHDVASFKPEAVSPINQDLEQLITNSNRSISTFAIATLLKTCNEGSVDRLIAQISQFLPEISDDFKVTVVEATRTLGIKFPNKHASIFTFLSSTLREEGGYDFKRAIVESLFDLIRFTESKDDALQHLAEFIEDSEFSKLTVRILHLLGDAGPKTKTPSKYVRSINNRLLLENAVVRAAAVSALGKFGLTSDAELKHSVKVLLSRCLDDVDDEVRDRACFALKMLDETDEVASRFIRNGVYRQAMLRFRQC
jgi:coatomer protein complex subunit gamma